MARVDIFCMNCGASYVYGLPGQDGAGHGPDGYLPGQRFASTCYQCRPDLNEENNAG